METNEVITQKKKPVIFKILGWISIVGSILLLIQSGLAISLFYTGYTLSPDLFSEISLPIQFMILGIPIILAILYFIEGIGFLKFKKWLPKLLLISLMLAIILQIIAYFDSIIFLIDPIRGLFVYFIKDAIAIWIGAAFVWYTFKKKDLFVN